uniref:Putative 37.6 kDa 2b protein n=1 Tax=Tobacco rattle virus TaxID=12295 RepID=Q6YA88_9VIRU|nr:putative 37.6 kDa 2b protein [Tobacco rattle virus]
MEEYRLWSKNPDYFFSDNAKLFLLHGHHDSPYYKSGEYTVSRSVNWGDPEFLMVIGMSRLLTFLSERHLCINVDGNCYSRIQEGLYYYGKFDIYSLMVGNSTQWDDFVIYRELMRVHIDFRNVLELLQLAGADRGRLFPRLRELLDLEKVVYSTSKLPDKDITLMIQNLKDQLSATTLENDNLKKEIVMLKSPVEAAQAQAQTRHLENDDLKKQIESLKKKTADVGSISEAIVQVPVVLPAKPTPKVKKYPDDYNNEELSAMSKVSDDNDFEHLSPIEKRIWGPKDVYHYVKMYYRFPQRNFIDERIVKDKEREDRRACGL